MAKYVKVDVNKAKKLMGNSYAPQWEKLLRQTIKKGNGKVYVVNVKGNRYEVAASPVASILGTVDVPKGAVKESKIYENKLRQTIRNMIIDVLSEEEELEETSSVNAMGGGDAYNTPAAFVGRGGKQRKNKWHKTMTDRLGYETVWDEEDADELGSGAKKRSNYVGKNEGINLNEEEISQQAKDEIKTLLKSYNGKEIPDEKVHAVAEKHNISPHELESYIYSLASAHINESNQSNHQDYGDFSGKEMLTGKNDFKNKNEWVKKVAEMVGFEVVDYGEEPDTFVVKGDPQTVMAKTVQLYEGRRGRYQKYRDDNSMTVQQKIGESLKRMRKSLKELNREVNLNLRLKNESGIESDGYWKRTKRDLYKISEHIFKLMEKIRRF